MERQQWDILWESLCSTVERDLSAQLDPGARGSSTALHEYGGVPVTQMSWHAVPTPAIPKFISQRGEAYPSYNFIDKGL